MKRGCMPKFTRWFEHCITVEFPKAQTALAATGVNWGLTNYIVVDKAASKVRVGNIESVLESQLNFSVFLYAVCIKYSPSEILACILEAHTSKFCTITVQNQSSSVLRFVFLRSPRICSPFT